MSKAERAADRMPEIPPSKMTPEQKKAAEEFKAGRGYEPRGPFAVMLRSPQVMLCAKAMGDYLRFRNVLPKRVSEMVILFTAREWCQQYEWGHHYKIALEEGLDKGVAQAIAEGRRPEKMKDDEAAAYDFANELHRTRRVSDHTYARALAIFGEQGIIDIIGLNGYYTFNAMMMNVSRTRLEDGSEMLSRFPE